MHNLTKIKLFRILLLLSYPIALVLVYPLVLFKRKSSDQYFFFFDRYVIGGAQKVHIDLLNAIHNIHKQVYFTRFSPDSKLKETFYSIPGANCKDIHFWCDNLLIRLLTVHYYCFYINRHSKPFVFSSNSTFFYDMLFFLRKKVITAELLHNFSYGKNGMEFFGLANHKYLNYRLTVDTATHNNIIQQYKEFNVPAEYNNKVLTIEPGVIMPSIQDKDYTLPLQILYAGRGTPQKRIYLLNAVAEACMKTGIAAQFHFAGTMDSELSDYVKEHAVMHGEISNPADMARLYHDSHVILMTSAFEGFPMLIKEGMAWGCIPVVTALEGNKTHLVQGVNALLMEQPEDEKDVVATAIAHINNLIDNPEELKRLSGNSYKYAKENFDVEVFMEKYRSFFRSVF